MRLPLYPLRFIPLYQYRSWGGRRLAHFFSAPVPEQGQIGEAWLLSDRDDQATLVADGPLEGSTLAQLLAHSPLQMMGALAGRFSRFPLLLKFLDVSTAFSVQVHPSDDYPGLDRADDTGKTEAWVVLEVGSEARVYAGLKAGASALVLRDAIAHGTMARQLASFTPSLGDSVLIRAGAVHSLRDVVVFEVQQNSDVTFRLFDWNHVDSVTGLRRALHVDQAMSCIDFSQGAIVPGVPQVRWMKSILRERLVACEQFSVTRISGEGSFIVGEEQAPRVLVCLAGEAIVEHAGEDYAFGKGDVLLLPAEIGACTCTSDGIVSLLEISVSPVHRAQ